MLCSVLPTSMKCLKHTSRVVTVRQRAAARSFRRVDLFHCSSGQRRRAHVQLDAHNVAQISITVTAGSGVSFRTSDPVLTCSTFCQSGHYYVFTRCSTDACFCVTTLLLHSELLDLPLEKPSQSSSFKVSLAVAVQHL